MTLTLTDNIADAAKRFTPATVVGVSNYAFVRLLCLCLYEITLRLKLGRLLCNENATAH